MTFASRAGGTYSPHAWGLKHKREVAPVAAVVFPARVGVEGWAGERGAARWHVFPARVGVEGSRLAQAAPLHVFPARVGVEA